MKIATTTEDFSRFVQTGCEALPLLRKAGFRYADYGFGLDYNRKTGVYGDEWESFAASVPETAAALGIRLVQAHAPMGRPIRDRAVNRPFLEDTLRSVRVAGAWGIPNIVVHSGYEPGLSREETLEYNGRFFAEVLQEAEKTGIRILVENFNKMTTPTYWFDNAEDLRALIDMVDHPLFHACWDIGHANLQAASQTEQMRVLGGDIRALHVNDNSGAGDEHLEMYFGTVNLDDVMHALFEIGYDGYFTFESCANVPKETARRTFDGDARLFRIPLDVFVKLEEAKYQIGKSALSAYGCFEE